MTPSRCKAGNHAEVTAGVQEAPYAHIALRNNNTQKLRFETNTG